MARFDIETFKAVIDGNLGLAKPNRFFVSMVPPRAVETNIQVLNNIEFFCEAVNLPGFILQTSDNRRYTYGPIDKRPYGPMFEPLRLTVLGDNKGNMWKFFHTWMNYILPHTLKGGIDRVVDTNIKSVSSYPYELEYKDNYVTDVAIYHLPENYDAEGGDLNSFDACITRTICRDAFPSAISDIQLSWAENNSIATFQVQMDFTDWHNVRNEN